MPVMTTGWVLEWLTGFVTADLNSRIRGLLLG